MMTRFYCFFLSYKIAIKYKIFQVSKRVHIILLGANCIHYSRTDRFVNRHAMCYPLSFQITKIEISSIRFKGSGDVMETES